MNATELMKSVYQINNCKPIINQFYDNRIKGSELYEVLLANSEFLTGGNNEAYENFISQINIPEYIYKIDALPKQSSGSFYTAFCSGDFIYNELEEGSITVEECEILCDALRQNLTDTILVPLIELEH